MKTVATYIGYFMAVVGVVTLIWRTAVSFQKDEQRDTEIEKRLVRIEEKMVTKSNLCFSIDSLGEVMTDGLGQSVEATAELVKSQNAMRRSFLRFVRRDSLQLEEFLEVMEGLEFELQVPRIDTTDLKIKIRKMR